MAKLILSDIDVKKFCADAKAVMTKQNLTTTALAEKAGITKSVFLKMQSGKVKNPSLQSVTRLCKVLKLDIKDYQPKAKAAPKANTTAKAKAAAKTFAKNWSELPFMPDTANEIKIVTPSPDPISAINELKAQLTDVTAQAARAQDEIKNLNETLKFKNERVQAEMRRADTLQATVDEDDLLLLTLLNFLQRLKGGEVHTMM